MDIVNIQDLGDWFTPMPMVSELGMPKANDLESFLRVNHKTACFFKISDKYKDADVYQNRMRRHLHSINGNHIKTSIYTIEIKEGAETSSICYEKPDNDNILLPKLSYEYTSDDEFLDAVFATGKYACAYIFRGIEM